MYHCCCAGRKPELSIATLSPKKGHPLLDDGDLMIGREVHIEIDLELDLE